MDHPIALVEDEDGQSTFLPWGKAFEKQVGENCPEGGCTTVSLEVDDLAYTQIAYEYDPLGRLTEADYGDGSYYRYTYDRVGNRLSEKTLDGTVVSTYDDANRLTAMGETSYTWDANGNLLSDGVNTYTYNTANRLVGVSSPQAVLLNGGVGSQFIIIPFVNAAVKDRF